MVPHAISAVLLCVCLVCGGAAPSQADGEAFLKENKKKEGVITLASGLQYKVLKAGEGKFHPKASTVCDCHYAGSLIDGTEFDSSYKRGEPTSFAPNGVIKGWTEAMQLMVEGDKWQMFISPDLAYGSRGAGATIPGGATLIFTMELLRIKGPKVPADQAATVQAALGAAKDSATIGQGPQHTEQSKARFRAFSWNIFRYIGDLMHLGGIMVLFLTLCKNRALTGLSKGTQILYAMICFTRYLDVFDGQQSTYLLVFKITYTVSSVIVLSIFQMLAKSYEGYKDTCSLVVICMPCVTAAILVSDDYTFSEVCWTLSQFLEGFAMVPQYIFCYRDKGASDFGVALYVMMLGGYRVFYVMNWIYKKYHVPHYNDVTSWVAGMIEVCFFMDFLLFRFIGKSALRTMVLTVDEKVNDIQEAVEVKVFGSSRSRTSAAGGEGGGGLRRRGKAKESDDVELTSEV